MYPYDVRLLYSDTETVSSVVTLRLCRMKAQQNLKYRILQIFLRNMREQAELTQRELGQRLNKPQSWVYNCETANRRVDITEFVLWAKACEIEPKKAFSKILKELV